MFPFLFTLAYSTFGTDSFHAGLFAVGVHGTADAGSSGVSAKQGKDKKNNGSVKSKGKADVKATDTAVGTSKVGSATAAGKTRKDRESTATGVVPCPLKPCLLWGDSS
jgi:hypothetical protein